MSVINDLDMYAAELDGTGWHGAALVCRNAITEITHLRALLHGVLNGDPKVEQQAREMLYGEEKTG